MSLINDIKAIIEELIKTNYNSMTFTQEAIDYFVKEIQNSYRLRRILRNPLKVKISISQILNYSVELVQETESNEVSIDEIREAFEVFRGGL